MLYADNIYLDVELNSRKEIFEFIRNELYQKGFVKADYAEALEKREINNPTGLPTVPYGIAIPHTDVEFVEKPCIIMIRLKNSVSFEQMGSLGEVVDASFVFGLVFTDGKKQVDLLAGIVALAQNQEDMEILNYSDNREVIINIIKKYVE